MTMKAKWNPRGEVRWPFRKAVPGVTRVRHVRSGMTGTFVRWPAQHHPTSRNPGYAVIDWDNGARGRVVAYAYDLELAE